MALLHLLCLFCLIGFIFPFLMDTYNKNSTGTLTDHSYHDLIQLLIDEKESRHHLENKVDILTQRLDAMDQLHAAVNVQLDKDKNHRESTSEKLTDIYHQLRNLTSSREHVMTLVKAENDALQRIQLNVSNAHGYNNEMFTNMTNNLSDIEGKLIATARPLGHQIGFAVYTPDKHRSTNYLLKFKKILFSSDNVYDMSSGIVTFKVAGLYYFSLTIVRTPNTTEAYCCLDINNTNIPELYTVATGATQNGYLTGTTSLVYHMNAGDIIKVADCGGIDYMHWTSGFQGFLISADTL